MGTKTGTGIIRRDPGSKVVGSVGNDLVTAGIGAGSAAAFFLIPGFGWMIGTAGFVWIGVRAVKRGLKKAP